MKTLFMNAFVMLVLCLASNETIAQTTAMLSESDTQSVTELEPNTDKEALVKKIPMGKKPD